MIAGLIVQMTGGVVGEKNKIDIGVKCFLCGGGLKSSCQLKQQQHDQMATRRRGDDLITPSLCVRGSLALSHSSPTGILPVGADVGHRAVCFHEGQGQMKLGAREGGPRAFAQVRPRYLETSKSGLRGTEAGGRVLNELSPRCQCSCPTGISCKTRSLQAMPSDAPPNCGEHLVGELWQAAWPPPWTKS